MFIDEMAPYIIALFTLIVLCLGIGTAIINMLQTQSSTIISCTSSTCLASCSGTCISWFSLVTVVGLGILVGGITYYYFDKVSLWQPKRKHRKQGKQ